MIARIIKVIIFVAIAAIGYVVLDPVRWPILADPLSLNIPAAWSGMRLERLWFGSAITLLGVLGAVSALMPARRR